LARMSARAWEILDTAEPRTISPRMLARVSLVAWLSLAIRSSAL
jgi:hypothetical protein